MYICTSPQTSQHTAMSAPIFHSIFFFLILQTLIQSPTADDTMVPLIEPKNPELMNWVLNGGRRKLNAFQICSLCTCCNSGGNSGSGGKYCTPSPCCYAINCNIPNRPFGFCSFTPKTCNCFGCNV